MTAHFRLATIAMSAAVMSAALLFAPDVTNSTVMAGEPSAEFRAGIQRIVEQRKQKRIAKVERERAMIRFWQAQEHANRAAADAAARKERGKDWKGSNNPNLPGIDAPIKSHDR
jgi:hypothetical protein